ncbi:MAG: ABC transporter permease [Methanobacteriaceae archaeon]|jgi:ABC-type transport system involved in multi-copper enzyme maturation permease subunit|nr:ABC transporter permease [Candidatus Methanorudis spinitermitis]
MNIRKSWVIAIKDFEIFKKKKEILMSLFIFPLIMGIVFPLIILGIIEDPNLKVHELITAINTFSLLYIMLPGFIPPSLASYSIVGEKTEKTLEPLLASPITDDELLFGKIIASFLPSIFISYLSALLFMLLINIFTYDKLHYFFFPNWNMGVILLLIIPFVILLSVEVNVLISSKISDLRTASQLGALSMTPFLGLYFAFQTYLIGLNLFNLLVLILFLVFLVVTLFILTKSVFNREKILTKWD